MRSDLVPFEEVEIRTRTIKTMAHPVCLIMIELLRTGEHSFSEIFDLSGVDASTVSKQLLVLKEAEVVSSRKTGIDGVYRLDVPCVTGFFSCLTAVI